MHGVIGPVGIFKCIPLDTNYNKGLLRLCLDFEEPKRAVKAKFAIAPGPAHKNVPGILLLPAEKTFCHGQSGNRSFLFGAQEVEA
jgi:hypothetical protein